MWETQRQCHNFHVGMVEIASRKMVTYWKWFMKLDLLTLLCVHSFHGIPAGVLFGTNGCPGVM